MVVSKEVKPHIALLPSPGMGHITPLFEFAKRLVTNHGILVSFLVITADASAAQTQLFQSPDIPAGICIVNIPPVDMSNVINENTLVLSRVCLTVQESLKLLRSILVEVKPKVLIVDLFTSQAIEVARELSISVYSFYTASAGLLAFSLYLPTLDREVEGEYVDLLEPIKVPGTRPERIEDLLDQVRNRKIDEYKWFLFHMSRLALVDGILENSWEDLEPLSLKAVREHEYYKTVQAPPVYPIGPLIKPDEFITDKDARIFTWLDNQPPDSVLFVAFGSGGTLTSEQLTELAWGLEMSEQRFILVARNPSDASASAAFFNVGGDQNDPSTYLPEGFAERTQGVGLIVHSWVPQAAILGHSSSGAFLSHCGWNSSLESLSHGVPILAWPLYAEQRMNATLLEEGVGVAVKPVVQPGKKVVGREEIERVVRLIMEGEEGKVMRRRAEQLKESADTALSCGGSSYNSVCQVADIWKSLV
ncbi:anthocyanidin 3-O-glucosyltransferase 5-like [Coffea arabica]|uniref:Glycosyltransferase n=1 Tax=Coffea arabica TaxID=13443 RepID=A0A6P6UQI0_COFAR|nr:anthocyanidin 3-O-glucosyltransferase 5-like [Coffea arabica]